MNDSRKVSLSLIYPVGYDTQKSRESSPALSEKTAEQLDLYSLLPFKSSSFNDFFTSDPEVIRYRQNTFRDIEKNPHISDILKGMIPFLTDISELRRMGEGSDSDSDGYLYSISEIEIYSSLMEYLHDELAPLIDTVSSDGMKNFINKVNELTESDYFKTLNEKLNELASRVRDIKSITVGVNFDRKLMPESSGVISVNSEQFKSGDFFDKVKRLDFRKDDMTFIADLIPYSKDKSETRQLALTNAVNNAITDVFKSSVRQWKNAVRSYVSENTDFLIAMIPEAEFLSLASDLMTELKEKGCSLTYPEITSNGEFHAKELVNPLITLKTSEKAIGNNFDFDTSARIYVLTGPNRGGKSVLTTAVGYAFVLAQLGLPVCAEAVSISPADKILTHFPAGNEDTVEKGRLGEECVRLSEIFENISENSLVLLDESLSSTGSFEGAAIASEVLEGLSLSGCRAVFSTHLHELAASVDSINEETKEKGGVRIDNLVAELCKGERTFRIIRKHPDGKSYAKDIAKKYGLSLEDIISKINKQS